MSETDFYLTKMTNDRCLGTFKQNDTFPILGNIRQVSNLIFPQVKTVKNEVTDEI
jgi:hypothetical protein